MATLKLLNQKTLKGTLCVRMHASTVYGMYALYLWILYYTMLVLDVYQPSI